MPDTTSKGFPYPEGPDAVDVAGDIQALAEAIDDMPGVQSYTGTEITNLTAGEKWAGRIVWNSTTGKLQVSNGSTFSDVDTSSPLSSANPQALGSAAAGSSTDVSRADHVHPTTGLVLSSLFTNKGDLIVRSASAPARLGVGSNGQALVADSAETLGVKWATVAAGATGGGTDQVFYENDQTVTTNYTITSSRNALSAGPLTIGTGVTVTVPTGSVWAIV